MVVLSSGSLGERPAGTTKDCFRKARRYLRPFFVRRALFFFFFFAAPCGYDLKYIYYCTEN